jgi:hypothetical protein
MTNTQIVEEINRLPLAEKIHVIELVLKSIRLESEKSPSLAEGARALLHDYENDKEYRGVREMFGAVGLGQPTGADNESIDADLTREYASTHEDE